MYYMKLIPYNLQNLILYFSFNNDLSSKVDNNGRIGQSMKFIIPYNLKNATFNLSYSY